MDTEKQVNKAGSDTFKMAMAMNEDIEHFHKSNGITRKDAELCLQEYAPKFNWSKTKPRILDIGTGDGSVTKILTKYLPIDYEVLIGVDINPKSLKFATEKYGTNKIKFLPLNIEGELPDNMKNSFDHVFSFFTFNWVDDHKKAFMNIYNTLDNNGEFFAIFPTFADLYLGFEILSKTDKWGAWMNDLAKFPSPYYNFEDPDIFVSKMLHKIGFNILDVRCKQRLYYFESIEIIKGLLTAMSSFDIPNDLWPDFLDDYVEVHRYMNNVDVTKGTVKIRYNLMIIHCTK